MTTFIARFSTIFADNEKPLFPAIDGFKDFQYKRPIQQMELQGDLDPKKSNSDLAITGQKAIILHSDAVILKLDNSKRMHLEQFLERVEPELSTKPFLLLISKGNPEMEQIKQFVEEYNKNKGTNIALSTHDDPKTIERWFKRLRTDFSYIRINYNNDPHKFHFFKASINPQKNFEFLKPEDLNLTGNALKYRILGRLKEAIEQAKDEETFTELCNKIKSSPEYDIIKTGQGIMTRIRGLETDSHKALISMLKTRANDLELGDDVVDTLMSEEPESRLSAT
ncbi:hypothetical protein [Legionella cardiaca]|uniref:DrrA phosphatidylinositol 4-phosphate binding domain-containing protein n=1 Tax=Legionella cardiaca TaxID=1071983 RepID=A0ABY8APP1_9GAMM|nr:hypothetical protein [Legionella cardiaca]WED42493.1 hypothetical protein PXX05_11280 [Legionella cardiaca]